MSKFDWSSQAYAAAPTLSPAGRKDRERYLEHWEKNRKPEDPLTTAHIEALNEYEKREQARLAEEQKAIDALIEARNSAGIDKPFSLKGAKVGQAFKDIKGAKRYLVSVWKNCVDGYPYRMSPTPERTSNRTSNDSWHKEDGESQTPDRIKIIAPWQS